MTLLKWAWNAETAEKRYARMLLLATTAASLCLSLYVLSIPAR